MAGDHIDDLMKLFIFQLLTREEIEGVLSVFNEKIYPAETVIFSEGERGDTMYVVTAGAVKIFKVDNKQEKEIAVLGAGDFFGEVTLFDYAFRTASAKTLEGTSLLAVRRDTFNDFFLRNSTISSKMLFQMMAEMSRRVRKSITPSLVFF